MPPLRTRQAVRALVLDDDDCVLLVRVAFPSWTGWIAPGGGVARSECDEAALRRELLEETGLATFELGPLVWTRRHDLRTEGWDDQVERYFLVRTPRFEPAPALAWKDLNDEYVRDLRWWTLDEVEVSRDSFAPRRLGALLRSLLENGPPKEPLAVGV
jgi:8-oxo-dGTP pyrophosphatase MutT (NUDIX family)